VISALPVKEAHEIKKCSQKFLPTGNFLHKKKEKQKMTLAIKMIKKFCVQKN